jgi:division protein 1
VGHTQSVECLDFEIPYGKIVSGSADKTIRIWEASSHQCLSTIQAHTGKSY